METYKGGQEIEVGGSIMSLEDESKEDSKCCNQCAKCEDRAVCVCVCVCVCVEGREEGREEGRMGIVCERG